MSFSSFTRLSSIKVLVSKSSGSVPHIFHWQFFCNPAAYLQNLNCSFVFLWTQSKSKKCLRWHKNQSNVACCGEEINFHLKIPTVSWENICCVISNRCIFSWLMVTRSLQYNFHFVTCFSLHTLKLHKSCTSETPPTLKIVNIKLF